MVTAKLKGVSPYIRAINVEMLLKAERMQLGAVKECNLHYMHLCVEYEVYSKALGLFLTD